MLDFPRPARPTDSALSVPFDGRLREASLNATWFLVLAEAARRIETWRSPYNESRPHAAPGVADAPGRRLDDGPAGP